MFICKGLPEGKHNRNSTAYHPMDFMCSTWVWFLVGTQNHCSLCGFDQFPREKQRIQSGIGGQNPLFLAIYWGLEFGTFHGHMESCTRQTRMAMDNFTVGQYDVM